MTRNPVGAGRAPANPPGLRVLVVEDCQESTRLVTRFLTAWGFKTETARNGTDALLLAEQFGPHAVLVDIGLPGLDGLHVAREIRKSAKDVLLVALTGRSEPEDIQSSKEAGFDHHLVKPVDFATLQLL